MVHPARDFSGEPPVPLMQSTLTRFAAFTHTSLGLQVCSEQSRGFAVLPLSVTARVVTCHLQYI